MQLLDPQPKVLESSFVLHNVTWGQYEALLNLFGDNQPGLRINYLQGALELWMPGREHERIKTLFGRLIEAFAEELDLELNGYGSTTFRNQAAERGLEPDECYCLGNLRNVPDIAIEVVVTSGLVDRLEIYRGLGVREVWVWREGKLLFYTLETPEQAYQVLPRSQILPQLDPELLLSHLHETNQTQSVKSYRQKLQGSL